MSAYELITSRATWNNLPGRGLGSLASRHLLGNQFDRGTAIDFHVSHTASYVATGRFGGLRSPK